MNGSFRASTSKASVPVNVCRCSISTRTLEHKAQGTLLVTATAGEHGWVDVAPPILVRAGDGFVAVPEVEKREITVGC